MCYLHNSKKSTRLLVFLSYDGECQMKQIVFALEVICWHVPNNKTPNNFTGVVGLESF